MRAGEGRSLGKSESAPLDFVRGLKRKAGFESFNIRISLQNLNFNQVGWEKWYGNQVIA